MKWLWIALGIAALGALVFLLLRSRSKTEEASQTAAKVAADPVIPVRQTVAETIASTKPTVQIPNTAGCTSTTVYSVGSTGAQVSLLNDWLLSRMIGMFPAYAQYANPIGKDLIKITDPNGNPPLSATPAGTIYRLGLQVRNLVEKTKFSQDTADALRLITRATAIDNCQLTAVVVAS